MALTYKNAGVDIAAGAALVDRIKPHAASTLRPEVMGGIGGFAGLCALPGRYRSPLLVTGTDGVGTKLKTAFAAQCHDTVGIDLVAMCVNDVIVTGAEPLLFLDYIGTGKLDVAAAERVVAGIAEGCRQAGCALVGGETAELPGIYADSEYDLVGFCVGVVERDEVRTGADLIVGDALIGLPSAGLHSNGHSLARLVVFEKLGLTLTSTPDVLGGTSVQEELLRPTRIYAKSLAALGSAGIRFKAAAHITGGGLIENPPRMFQTDDLAIELRTDSWQVPPVFQLIQSAGVSSDEMKRTFNMGLGMVLAVAAQDAERAVQELTRAGEAPIVVGRIRGRDGGDPVVFV